MNYSPRKKNKKKRFWIFISFLFLLVLISTLFAKKTEKKGSDYPPVSQFTPLVDEDKPLVLGLKNLGVQLNGEPVNFSNSVVATLSSGTTVFFKKKSKEDYDFELASLQLILENIRIEGKWPLIIDLRLERPRLIF